MTENDPGTTEQTDVDLDVSTDLETEAPETDKGEVKKPRGSRAKKAGAQADVSVAQAAAVLGIYESEVAGVESTDAGAVVTTIDGHRYLLKSDVRTEPPHEGFEWLTKPAGRALDQLSED